MRNYHGYNSRNVSDEKNVSDGKKVYVQGDNKNVCDRRESRSRVVIDENTIYEIDMDCCEYRNKNRH